MVIILMGSKGDLEHGQKIATTLAEFGVESVMRVGSAHRTPEHALAILRNYEADPRPKVYVTIAGRSNALSGFADPQVSAPVIACPPPSDSYGGADVWSSLRMPAGVAPLLVLEPVNAAIAAAKILGLADAAVRAKVAAYQRRAADKILTDDASLQA
jgi:phosphoribosylaminoimidazole carboxylase PurE protein